MRELDLREREIAVQEKLAAKPSAAEWIEEKAKAANKVANELSDQLIRAAVAVAIIIVVVVVAAYAYDEYFPKADIADKDLVKAVVIGAAPGSVCGSSVNSRRSRDSDETIMRTSVDYNSGIRHPGYAELGRP